MPSTATTLDPNDPRLTERILPTPREIEPLPPNPYEEALTELGCWEKAYRSGMTRNSWKWYKTSSDLSDVFRKPLFTLMLRTDEYKAETLAFEQENTYHNLIEFIGENFTYLEFRFLAESCHLKSKQHASQQEMIRDIRKVIDRYLPHTLDKIGAMEDKRERYNFRIKAIHCGAVDSAIHQAIQGELPAGVVLQHHVYSKAQFHEQFTNLIRADLPRSNRDRAAFEVLLTRLIQILPHKFSRSERKRFAYTSEYVYANQQKSDALAPSAYCEECKKTHGYRIPRSPYSGLPAKFVSVTVSAATKVTEILPEEWMPLPLTS